MEKIEKSSVFEYPPDTLSAIRKLYDLDDEKRRNEALELFDEWVKKQTHFKVQDFDKAYLERTLITSKGSLERAKLKLEKLCTYKTLMPHLFQIYDVVGYFQQLLEQYTFIVLPKMTKDYNRVIINRVKASKNPVESKHISDFYKFGVILCEYSMAHDYANGISVILDYQDINVMDVITKLNILEMRQCIKLFIEGYGMVIKGIHVISSSKGVELLVTLFRQVLSAKVASRIFVHKDVTTLADHFERDILPQDYGGNEKHSEKIQFEWLTELGSDKVKEYLKQCFQAGTDESKRPKPSEDVAELSGSFRTLCVD